MRCAPESLKLFFAATVPGRMCRIATARVWRGGRQAGSHRELQLCR